MEPLGRSYMAKRDECQQFRIVLHETRSLFRSPGPRKAVSILSAGALSTRPLAKLGYERGGHRPSGEEGLREGLERTRCFNNRSH